MTLQSATHRGAPFAGRRREIALLTRLLDEALGGTHGLIRVAGETGSGRRRLIAEALTHGPDAEWIHLASGGVEPDLRRWVRTELIDLLDTYPQAPIPSWALHVLARWAPGLRRRARVPVLGPEPLAGTDGPEVVGSAVGAILASLTGTTLVVVELGIWPVPGTALERALVALGRKLQTPGAVALSASPREDAHRLDPPGVRTLGLGPLAVEEVEELVARWHAPADQAAAWAEWLHRVSGGLPFHLHELVRWLEESGHVRIEDEPPRVEPVGTIASLPLPLHLPAVMTARFDRLPAASQHLLARLAVADGRHDLERHREAWPGDPDDFEEALTALRRREFLLRRSARTPLALASPLWRRVAGPRLEDASTSPEADAGGPEGDPGPLLRIQVRLRRWAAGAENADDLRALHTEMAGLRRRLAGRSGAAWEGVRGRCTLATARRRAAEERWPSVLLWARCGLREMDAERHPHLRRAAFALGATAWERLRRPREAQIWRERAWDEALRAGHRLAAARLQTAVAEGARRLGEIHRAEREAAAAEREHETLGSAGNRIWATVTRIEALLDARDLERAREALAIAGAGAVAILPEPVQEGLERRLEALSNIRPIAPAPVVVTRVATSWGWGLDTGSAWHATTDAAAAETLGYATLAADLLEQHLAAQVRDGERGAADRDLSRLGRLLGALDAPARLRAVALALRETAAAGLPAYERHFRAAALHALGGKPPHRPRPIVLRLLGVAAVLRPPGSWPGALWPEWWTRLWAEAVAGDLLGDPPPFEELRIHLAGAGAPPAEAGDDLLRRANALFAGDRRVAGGLVLDRGRVAVVWEGIACDVREALLAFAHAEATSDREGWRRGMEQITGPFLPGLDGLLRVGALRIRLHRACETALDRLFAAGPPRAGEIAGWLEGAGHVAGVAPRAAALRAAEGRRLSAYALRRVSP